MSATARALAVSVLVTVAVWVVTLDWSELVTGALALTAPIPGIAAGLLAGTATLFLPAGRLGGKKARRGPRVRAALLPAGAAGGLLLIGYLGGRAGEFSLPEGVAQWGSSPSNAATVEREGPVAAPAQVPNGTAPGSAETSAEPAAAPQPSTGASEWAMSAPGNAGVKKPPEPTMVLATPVPPTPPADPARYLVEGLDYEPYPEAGAASLTLTFRDRTLDRPALAYYDLVRDVNLLTLTMTATPTEDLSRDFATGPIRSIRQSRAGDRLRLDITLAEAGTGIVDDTWNRGSGIRLFFVPGTGFGSLTHAPSPPPSGSPAAGR